jgi:hypothetical protein
MTEARAKTCIACGMPMSKPEDYPLRDESKDYCVHCARADGSMQSYEERAAGMAAFIVRTQGLDEGAALAAAKSLMARLPAWAGRQ